MRHETWRDMEIQDLSQDKTYKCRDWAKTETWNTMSRDILRQDACLETLSLLFSQSTAAGKCEFLSWDRDLWPMTLTFELQLHMANLNHSQISRPKVVSFKSYWDTQTDGGVPRGYKSHILSKLDLATDAEYVAMWIRGCKHATVQFTTLVCYTCTAQRHLSY